MINNKIHLISPVSPAQYSLTSAPPTEQGATIESEETYIGLTETTLKLRYANHTQSFRNSKLRNSTELSKHIC